MATPFWRGAPSLVEQEALFRPAYLLVRCSKYSSLFGWAQAPISTLLVGCNCIISSTVECMSSIGFNFILKKKKDSVVLFYCNPCYFIHRYLVSRYLERNLELGRRWSVQSSFAVIRVGPVSQRPWHHCQIHRWMESLAQLVQI